MSKITEELVRKSEALAVLGTWELNILTNALWWSDEIYNIFEIDPQKFEASYEAFLNAIHPEDRPLVDEAFTTSVENKEPYEVEHRLLMPDGRIKHVRERGETYYTEDGKPIRSFGVVHDITENKLVEEGLKRSEMSYRALFQMSLVPTIWADFSKVRKAIMALKRRRVKDFGKYFEKRSDRLGKYSSMIKVFDLNEAAVELFETPSKLHLMSNLKFLFNTELLKPVLISIGENCGYKKFESEIVTESGDITYVEVQYMVSPSHISTFSRVQISLLDITDRIKAELEKERDRKIRIATNQILTLSHSTEGIETILQKSLESILNMPFFGENPKGSIFVADANGDLEMVGSVGMPKSLQEKCAFVKSGDCHCGKVAELKCSQFSDFLDRRSKGYLRNEDSEGHYGIPILLGSKLLGVLNIYLTKGHRRDNHEVETLEVLSQTLSLVIDKKQSEKTIFESERKFRSIFNSITDIYYRTDSNDEIIVVSPSVEEFFGKKAGDIIGSKVEEFMSNRTSHMTIGRDLKEKGRVENVEVEFKRSDGVVVPMLLNIEANFSDDGTYRGTTGVARSVAQRKQAEREREKVLTRYQDLFENSHDAIFILDPISLTLAETNSAANKLLGFSQEEMIGLSFFNVRKDIEMEEVRRELQAVRDEGGKIFEIELTTKLGKTILVESSSKFVEIDGREYLESFVRDISQTKLEAIEQIGLQKNIEELIKREGIFVEPPAVAYKWIVEAVVKGLEIDRADIWFYNDTRDRIFCAHSYETTDMDFGIEILQKDHPRYFKAIEEELILAPDDPLTDPRINEFAKDYFIPMKINAAIYVPIYHHGNLIGIMCCTSLGPKRTWTSNEKHYLISISNLVSHVLNNENISRKNRELQESTKKYESLIQYSNDGILITDHEGKILVSNKSIERLLGYSKHDLIGRDTKMLRPKAEWKHLKEIKSQVQKLGGLIYESVLETSKGEPIDVEMSARQIKVGSDKMYQIFIRDIRERKKSEEMLEESELRYRSLNESFPDAIIISNGKSEIVSWNASAEKMFGYTTKEVIGQHFELIIPNDQRAKHSVAVRAFFSEKRRVRINTKTFEAQRKDGSIMPIEITLSNWTSRGEGFIGAVIRDVSEKKKAEDALVMSELNLKKAQHIAKVGSWQYDLQTKEFSASDEMKNIFGVSNFRADLTDVMMSKIHPEDAEVLNEMVAKLRGGIITEHVSHRIIVDGVVKHIEGVNEEYYDERLDRKILFGTIQDVTKSRNLENTLNKKNKLLDVLSKVEKIFLEADNKWTLANTMCQLIAEELNYSVVQIKMHKERSLIPLAIKSMKGVSLKEAFDWINNEKFKSPGKEAFFNKKEVMISDLKTMQRFKSWRSRVRKLGVEFFISIPFFVSNDIKGVVNFYSNDNRKDSEELDMLRQIVTDLAHHLESMKVAEVKDELFQYNTILTSSLSLATININLHYDTIKIHGASKAVFGYTLSDVSKSLDEFMSKIHPYDRHQFERSIRVWRGVHFDTEFRFVQPDGDYAWLNMIGQAFRDEVKEIVRVSGIVLNIDDKKNREGMRIKAEIAGKDAERKRISEEIHDGLGQTLTVANLSMNALRNTIIFKGDEKEIFQDAHSQIKIALKEAREISHDLMPSSLDRYGLISSIETDINKLNRTFDIQFNFYNRNVPDKMDSDVEINIYRIIAESISNIIKHSKAKTADIQLSVNDGVLLLNIEDDGVGFPKKILQRSNGIGLLNLRNRVKALGGDVSIDSRNGVSISVEIRI